MRVAFVSFAIALATASVAHAEEIKLITVEGNTKTTAATVELIADIDVGDDWTPGMMEEIKLKLVSSGLFKEVNGFFSPCSSSTMPACEEAGVRVHLQVADKHSWVIAPAFYTQPTNTGGGVGFGENNLFGENQKLLLYAQVATGDTFFIGAWVIPSINGTRFYAQLDTYLKSARTIEYAPPSGYTADTPEVRQSRMAYLNGGLKLGIELFGGLKFDARLRGAHVSYSDVKALTEDPNLLPDFMDPAPPGAEGWDISTELALTIDRRANYYGVQTGSMYRLSLEQGQPGLGSDFEYWLSFLSLWKGWQVLERHNLIGRLSVGVGNDLPFQQELLMGGTSMRGFINNQFRGDLRAMLNLEYSLPLFSLFGLSVRGLGFIDGGYVTFRDADSEQRNYLPNSARDDNSTLAPFKNSVGVGTRLYLRQIVLPLLGLDFGYGLEARDFQIYLAIGLTD